MPNSGKCCLVDSEGLSDGLNSAQLDGLTYRVIGRSVVMCRSFSSSFRISVMPARYEIPISQLSSILLLKIISSFIC